MSLHVCIVGAGRAGHAFAASMSPDTFTVTGPLGRHEPIPGPHGVDAVLLCVPEPALSDVAQRAPAGSLVGHCSASAPLSLLAPHEAFSIHPLMTLQGTTTRLAGAAGAVSATGAHAHSVALAIAVGLGMLPMTVPDDKRALYHAAASMASNFLVTLEGASERAALACGVPRDALVPLVRATVDAWAARGFSGAITGPIARGDSETVARQRAALARDVPELLPMFDAMASQTRSMLEPRNTT